jgi:hypothetical protein
MTKQPYSRLTALRLFWEAADAVMAKRGLPPLSFEAAVDWFESELEPEAVGELLEAHSPIAAKDLRMLVSRRLAELGINPFEAARRGGLERSFVNDILIGKKRSVRGDNIGKLAVALETDPVSLLDSLGL